MVNDDSRPTSSDPGVRRRDLMALGAATAIGTGLGTTTTAASVLDAQEDELAEAEGLFLAALTGGQQPDPVDTTATGGAVFSVSEDGSELEYALLVNAIEDADQAHIHLGPVGEEGPVAVWLYPDPAADSPELQEGRFDGILATGTITDEHLTDEVEGQTVEALVEEITGGNAYVNVHTEEYPGGEIRGQLAPVEDVAAALLEDEVRVSDDEPDVDDEPDTDEESGADDDEPDGDEEPNDGDTDEVITFIDCHTVRIVGDFPEVVIYPLELIPPGDEPGEPDEWFVGAMGSFPVGPVDGERTIDIEEEIEEGVIISAVDVLDGPFTEGVPVHERIHPGRDECIEQLFVDAGVEPPDDLVGEQPAEEPDETPNGEPEVIPDEDDVGATPNGEPNETEPAEEPDVTDGNDTAEDDT